MICNSVDEFVERCKALLDDPATCKCPGCGSDSLNVSYGLAGGGAGPYVLCLGCGDLVLKAFDEAPEAPA